MIKDQLYELTIDDENVDGVFAVSLVEQPAIESNFVFFGKEKEVIKFSSVDNEKRLVMGPILVPDKKILRVDEAGQPYHVFFKPATIERLSQMYLEKKYTDSATLEHAEPVTGVNLVESWITESRTKDKSAMYGLSVPVGTWMGTFRISNEELWQDFVKTGSVKGFSIEGLFSHKLVEASILRDYLEKEITELSMYEAAAVLKKIKKLIKSDLRYAKGKKLITEDMEGVAPSVTSTYPGQGPTKKTKKQTWSEVFASTK
jgi:hypothetical protein